MYGLTSTSGSLGLVGANGLNGLATSGWGMGGYGMGGYGIGFGGGTADVERVKTNLVNNYSLNATQQGLQNKHVAEASLFSQQCNNISSLLSEKRLDAVSVEFEKLVNNMKTNPQYAVYSDQEVRALAQSQYAQATGVNLLDDINQKTPSAFVQGMKSGVPIFGLFESTRSKDDITAQVTGTSVSGKSNASKMLGAALTGGAIGAGVTATAIAGNALKSNSAAIKGAAKGAKLSTASTAVTGAFSKTGKAGLVVGGVAAGVALLGGLVTLGRSKMENANPTT
ncbi:hypothetical protein tpqmel_0808 [Candidatus Gastranaerophilus sp. (ex Termes propinquus)]|nr:hypothetical protein tpqmel_0808 [Candidatus Gastranaerophilus sp. (ex Termes propinquus)]